MKSEGVPSQPIGSGALGPRARIKNLKLDPPKKIKAPLKKKNKVKRKLVKKANTHNPKNAKYRYENITDYDEPLPPIESKKIQNMKLEKLPELLDSASQLEAFEIEEYEEE